MSKVIHISIQDESGNEECWGAKGNLWLAIRTLIALWRYGDGQITIKSDEPPSSQ